VIFTTAYEEHALRAFELAAVDYLLKPIRMTRLQVALDRVSEKYKEKGLEYMKDINIGFKVNVKKQSLKPKLKHRPFLKWAGGKFRLTDDINKAFPNKKNCLIEPFVGAGAVFLNSNFERYILADINPDLINLFNIVKEDETRQYVVVSAPGKRNAEDTKVTDALIKYYKEYTNGKDTSQSQEWIITTTNKLTLKKN